MYVLAYLRGRTAALSQANLDAQRQQLAYSVETLRGRFLLENTKALESLEFERAEGPAIFDDISPKSILVRQSARLCLVLSHNMI